MSHAIWKGAISFGLVHVPVALYPAAQDIGIDFDWLDKRTMDPVGYKRINKRTGKEIQKENIVKGIKQEDGQYVLLSDEEIKAAFPKSTQTIEIESFVKTNEIPFFFLEQPYFLEPYGKGDKVYALLREAMLQADVIGVARVVMHTKEHLAALIPTKSVLMLNTLRWSDEIKSAEELKLPVAQKVEFKPGELKMAAQLIKDMSSTWKAEEHKEAFAAQVQRLVSKKLEAGETKTLAPLEDTTLLEENSNVLDLTQLLAQSLKPKSLKPKSAPSKPAKNNAK